MKGVESLRRDAYMIVRETMDACLKMILIDNDNEKAMAYVGEVVKRVMTDEIDLSKFIATKSISRDIKDYTMPQCHTVLAQKIEKRNPGSGPRKGSRVPYVIIQGAKNDKTRDKAEDPIYVLKHDIPIDKEYYIKQMKSALSKIFKYITKDVEALFKGDHTRRIVKKIPKNNSGILRFVERKETCGCCGVVF